MYTYYIAKARVLEAPWSSTACEAHGHGFFQIQQEVTMAAAISKPPSYV